MDHAPDPAPSGRPEGKPLTVGEAATRIGVATHVLRHWEDVGVLVPGRDPHGHRRYTDADVRLARGVLAAQSVGLSLAQVRSFLGADAAGRADLLAGHSGELRRRIRDLSDAAAQVEQTLARSGDPECPYGL